MSAILFLVAGAVLGFGVGKILSKDPVSIKPVQPENALVLTKSQKKIYNKFIKQINSCIQTTLGSIGREKSIHVKVQLSGFDNTRLEQTKVLNQICDEYRVQGWEVDDMRVHCVNYSTNAHQAQIQFTLNENFVQRQQEAKQEIEKIVKS